MTEADFSGDYINVENTQDKDILEIVGEAVYADITNKQTGQVRKVLNIPVSNQGKLKTYTPGMEAGKALIKAFSKETKAWIGKKVQANVINYKSFGVTKQTIDCMPVV